MNSYPAFPNTFLTICSSSIYYVIWCTSCKYGYNQGPILKLNCNWLFLSRRIINLTKESESSW